MQVDELELQINIEDARCKILDEEIRRIHEFIIFRENFVKLYKENGAGLIISGAKVTEINSADGVSIALVWAHIIPDKTVKYLDVYITPFNAVGDPVKCSVRGNSQFKGRVTGPVYFDYEFQNSVWENAWYNNTVLCVKVDRVDVFYMDGSKYIYINELPKLYGDQFKNDCSFKGG